MFSLAWSAESKNTVASDLIGLPEVSRSSLLAPKQEHAPRVFPHRRWPMHHSGNPGSNVDQWNLRVFGAVQDELDVSFSDLASLPGADTLMDPSITSYRYRAKEWSGVDLVALLSLAGVRGDADWLVAHSEGGYSTVIHLDQVFEGRPVLAWQVDGKLLSNRDGGPVRLLLPNCEARMSAKWVRGLELRSEMPS